jgi:hypothetical protein
MLETETSVLGHVLFHVFSYLAVGTESEKVYFSGV